MASTSETGHSINIANFEQLIAFCKSYGAAYNPSNAQLSIPELQALLANSKNAFRAVGKILPKYVIAVNQRKIAFKPLNILVTRLLNGLDASGATDLIVEDARTLARKISGKRKGKIHQPKEGTNISVSQQSFDVRLGNFRELVTLLENEPLYYPNETDLQLATLNSFINTLEAANNAVMDAATLLSNTRLQRNKVLYEKNTSMVGIALEVKKYVKSVFGGASPQYQQLSCIRFRRMKS